jgi:predicted aldo/keto reductase-like oxidoreductase
MKVTRRGFLSTTAAAGLASPLRQSGVSRSDVFTTPPTVGSRNGMPYRAFGKTGEDVSILGVGGFHIGVPAEADGIRLIRTAIDAGVNFMDNAWEYNDGESERRMGRALRDGYRDKTFLMTKGCARDAQGAMQQLEDSLRQLQTDVIDLWQFHECNYDDDPDLIFAADGAIHAAVKAKEQGKIRFIGFTGHKSPHIHLKMLAQNFEWDALQMPLNLCDAHYRSFTREVLPVALERGIAVIAMKTQGGGAIPANAPVTALDCLRYSMSLNVPVCLSGMADLDVASENIALAKRFEPLPVAERNELLERVLPFAGAGALERFKTTQRYDSGYHQKQHGFL